MSTLRVRVDKFLESEGGPPPQVFARVQRLDDRGRSVADTLDHVLIPISHHANDAVEIALSPGMYAVEVKMPSGEWLSDAVHVVEGTTNDLVLQGAATSRDWLGWQHLNNAVREPFLLAKASKRPEGTDRTTSRSPRLTASAPRATRGATVTRSAVDRMSDVLGRVGLPSVYDGPGVHRTQQEESWESERPSDIEVARPLYWLPGGPAKMAIDILRDDPWRSLHLLRGSPADIVEALNAGRTARIVEPAERDDTSALFPVPNRSGLGATGFAPIERNFVAVHRHMGVELVCLPTPWIEQSTDREVSVEVRVQRPRLESEFASTVAVRDRQLSVLLGFLSSGALPAAKRIAETAGDMLNEKHINPLAAAAGGYALVSSVADTQPQHWHDWIENLMHRFEHVPDGAIQFATMRLRLRRNEQDSNQATEAFKSAYKRGLPYFGLGMRWLLEGLQRVGTRDPEAKAMAESVYRLTSRLHPQSPFTVLRLGRQ